MEGRLQASDPVGSARATLADDVFQHCRPKQGINSGLIPFALFSQPRNHVGIQSDGELALDRPVERIAHSVLPKAVCERRDVRVVDLAIWHRRQGRDLAPLLGGQWTKASSFDVLFHSGFFPFG